MKLAPILDLDKENARLVRLDDWHEHDGYISAPVSTSWAELQRQLANDDAFVNICSDDTYVRLAFYSSDFEFYLRVHVAREGETAPGHARLNNDPGDAALLDVTCSSDQTEKVKSVMFECGINCIQESIAWQFFDRTYSG